MASKGKRKLILLPLIIILSVAVAYFGSALVAFPIIKGAAFGRRGKDKEELLLSDYYCLKLQGDYENLSKRTVHNLQSGGNVLTAYFYDVPNEKGLILTAHGLGSCADADDAEYQSYFVELGYDVFALDLTGSGLSEGKGTASLWQSAYDVKAAYDYLLGKSMVPASFYLAGHSWGAFGVAASLSLGVKASGVISFSGYENPRDMMFSYAESYAGFIATASRPAFYLAESIYQGKDGAMSAYDSLRLSKAKALLIQGDLDKTVKLEISLYEKAKELPNVTSLLLEGTGHNGPWRSKEATAYFNEVAKPLFEENKANLTLEKAKELRSRIDLEKSSELDERVLSAINSFLDNA